jgi:hypothetical protein
MPRTAERTPILLLLALLFCSLACDNHADESPPSTAPAVPVDSPLPSRVKLQTLAILAPNRPTHIAAAANGKVYFCQQNEDGRDAVLTLDARDLAEPTALSTATIAEALGKGEMLGNIVALAASPADGGLWFYFVSKPPKRAAPEFYVGHYNPGTTRIRIVADTNAILSASGMGASIELASVDLVATRSTVWLWLRHMDESVLLAIDAGSSATGRKALTRKFPRVLNGFEELPMNRPEYQLSAASAYAKWRLPGDRGDDLLLVDAWTGALFRVDPAGRASLIDTLIGLPVAMAPAAPMMLLPDGRARILLFAAEGSSIEPKLETRVDAPTGEEISFPAFLIFEILPKNETRETPRPWPIPHARVSGRIGFPAYALRLTRLLPEANGESYLAYDAASGEVMRVTLLN